MDLLEGAAGKLFNIWRHVEAPLEIEFIDITDNMRGGSVVLLETVKVN